MRAQIGHLPVGMNAEILNTRIRSERIDKMNWKRCVSAVGVVLCGVISLGRAASAQTKLSAHWE